MPNRKIYAVKTPQQAEVAARADNPLRLERGETTMIRKKAWDRLPGEYPQHFEWFKAYRDLGKRRTYELASQAIGLTGAHGQFQRVANKQEWVERARLYDEWVVDTESEAGNKVLEQKAAEQGEDWGAKQAELRRRQYDVGHKLLKAVEKRVLLADGISLDDEGNETGVEPIPFSLRDKDYIALAKGAVALMSTAIAPPTKGLAEEDEFAGLEAGEMTAEQQIRYLNRHKPQLQEEMG